MRSFCLIFAQLLDRFTLDGVGAALGAALLIGVLNALVFPTLARLTLPLNVLTLGLAAIVINAILVAFAIDLVPGAEITGLAEAIVVTIALTVATSATASLLAIDDDESWYRNVVDGQARSTGGLIRTNVPGVLFLEIDGLAHEVLQRAIAAGRTPNIKRWIEDGSHRARIAGRPTGPRRPAPVRPGCCTATTTTCPRSAGGRRSATRRSSPTIPRTRSRSSGAIPTASGLLHADGASRANILSGDATHSMLTMSTVLTRRRPIGRDYSAYFARPYATFKTLNAVVAEYFRERYAAITQKRARREAADRPRPQVRRSSAPGRR